MPDSEFLNFTEEILSNYLGKETKVKQFKRLTGGCINEAFRIESSAGNFFLKHNQPDFEIQFEKEARSLRMLHQTNTIKTPEVFHLGTLKNRAFLLMEYVHPGTPSNKFWQNFGEKLASLHRTTAKNQQFGLSFDNYIGSLPQKNTFHQHWIDFFIENRLEVQIKLAHQNDLVSNEFINRFQKIYEQLPGLLTKEPPSLIHGDLWSGNYLNGPDGEAALIDPATYFGNREIEIAFTQLFGGFPPAFYESYQRTWPLAPGFEERVDIYNLYPLLVHVNLFGTSYLTGIEKVIRRYT